MSLRCPVCGEAKWFNITSPRTFTFTETEHLAGAINSNKLGISPNDACSCDECGHTDAVSAFRKYHEYYEKPAIVIDQLWECINELGSIGETVSEKDDCLGAVILGAKLHMNNLLKNLEARLKNAEG